MARKIKSDYKRIYREYFGIQWNTKLFEIHHLDHNRNNNNIENLVLLPKKLHHRYHMYQHAFVDGVADILKVGVYYESCYVNGYQANMISKLIDTKNEITKFIQLRDNTMYCMTCLPKEKLQMVVNGYIQNIIKLNNQYGSI